MADHETVASIEESVSREKRDRYLNVAQTLKDRQHLQNFLEQKAELAVRGDNAAQKRLSEAEADMEIRNWEKRNSDIALHESHQELESQRLQIQQAQREKMNLCGELETRNRLSQESRARNCQEIEELRRIGCEERDRARQARIGDLSVHQKRHPTFVSQLLTQVQALQNEVSSLSDAREFLRSEAASSSGASHVPSEPIPSPRSMPCRDSGLAHDTRTIKGNSGNVFERVPAREGPTSLSSLGTFKEFGIIFLRIET